MQESQAAIAGSANTRLIGQGSSGLLVLVASALFWSWFDSGVFRPTFLAPFTSSTWMFLPYLITALAAGGIVLLVACLRSKHQIGSDSPQPMPGFGRQRWIYAAVCAFAGAIASLSGAALGLLPLLLLGATGTGASCGFFQLAWGSIYARAGSGFAGRTVALSIALGVLIDAIVMGLGTWFAAAFTTALPLISCGLVLFLMHEDALPQAVPQKQPDPQAHEAIFGSHRTLGGLPLSLLVAFGLFGLSFGYCQQNAVFLPAGLADYSSDALIAARGLTSLVIYVLLTFLPLKSYAVFKVGTLVGIAGFVAAPLLGLINTQGIAQSIIIAIGYTTFDIATWALMAELVVATRSQPARLIGSGRFTIHAAEALSIVACNALAAFPGTSDALNSTFGYGCVIAEMLLLADNSALWLLIRADNQLGSSAVETTGPSRPDTERGSTISETASAYGLTERESEVLALLAAGHGRARVAQALGISENTLGTHIQQLYRKLGVHSRQELLDKLNEQPDG